MSAATLATARPVKPDATAIADFAAMKTRQQAAWSSGNYAVVGTTAFLVLSIVLGTTRSETTPPAYMKVTKETRRLCPQW